MLKTKPITTRTDDVFGRPLRDLRISVTDRCNFRCPYCMPAEIYGESHPGTPRSDILTFEEILRLARLFASRGAQKIRLTGGEPLLRHDLPTLIAGLKEIDGVRDVALTTNGYLLERVAKELAQAGLDRVTVSLDSHDPEVFRRMSGRPFGPERVLAGIDAAVAAGLTPIKLNCVVQRGVNDHQVVDMASRFRGTGHILRFIEYMDVGTLNRWDLRDVVSAAAIRESIEARYPLQPVEPSYPGEVATRFRYRDGQGEVGFIASVTQPFCGACTRARLTTQGHFVTCLFAAGGVDLRTPLREGASDDELLERIVGTWTLRRDRYSEERADVSRDREGEAGSRRMEMYQIGG